MKSKCHTIRFGAFSQLFMTEYRRLIPVVYLYIACVSFSGTTMKEEHSRWHKEAARLRDYHPATRRDLLCVTAQAMRRRITRHRSLVLRPRIRAFPRVITFVNAPRTSPHQAPVIWTSCSMPGIYTSFPSLAPIVYMPLLFRRQTIGAYPSQSKIEI